MNCRTLLLAAIGLVLTVITFAQVDGPEDTRPPVDDEDAETRDIVLGDSCTTSPCHVDLDKGKSVHGPVSTGDCTSCHVNTLAGKHEFRLLEEGKELCQSCHDPLPIAEYEHEPVAEGMCTSCHDPHRSSQPSLLRANPAGRLCYICHEKAEILAGEHVHGPLAAGECLACHEVHGGQYSGLLNLQSKDLCYSCHTEARDRFEEQTHRHQPATEDCSTCHDPHSSAHAYQLRASQLKLCWLCHGDLRSDLKQATHIHGAMKLTDKCLNCHDVHASKYEHILKQDSLATCLSCHDKEIEVEGRRPLLNMKEHLDESKFLHGPIAQGNCVACHLPHAASTFRLLVEEYPPKFYAPFELEQYGLCFRCHDEALVTDSEDINVTGFHDGERNLHYLHVNREKKGRTCRACHAIHGSQLPFHIRDSVPFGSWEIPIGFKKSESGGSCAPGCHKKQVYNRKSAPGR